MESPGGSTAPVGVTMGIKAALPRAELYFYSTVLCLATFSATSWIFQVSSGEYEDRREFLACVVQLEALIVDLLCSQRVADVE